MLIAAPRYRGSPGGRQCAEKKLPRQHTSFEQEFIKICGHVVGWGNGAAGASSTQNQRAQSKLPRQPLGPSVRARYYCPDIKVAAPQFGNNCRDIDLVRQFRIRHNCRGNLMPLLLGGRRPVPSLERGAAWVAALMQPRGVSFCQVEHRNMSYRTADEIPLITVCCTAISTN